MKNLLFRQVHPVHFKNGLSSGAFRPTPNDKDKLSVDCGNMTTAEAAYNLHLGKKKQIAGGCRVALETAGTWAFTRELCAANHLSVTADPLDEDEFQPANTAHHLVDFSGIEGKPAKKNGTAAKRLKQKALEIGRLWPLVE